MQKFPVTNRLHNKKNTKIQRSKNSKKHSGKSNFIVFRDDHHHDKADRPEARHHDDDTIPIRRPHSIRRV